jgi:hypothetical protein
MPDWCSACEIHEMKWQGRRLLHPETVAMEFLLLPQSMQGGGVLRGSDALPPHKSCCMSPGFLSSSNLFTAYILVCWLCSTYQFLITGVLYACIFYLSFSWLLLWHIHFAVIPVPPRRLHLSSNEDITLQILLWRPFRSYEEWYALASTESKAFCVIAFYLIVLLASWHAPMSSIWLNLNIFREERQVLYLWYNIQSIIFHKPIRITHLFSTSIS